MALLVLLLGYLLWLLMEWNHPLSFIQVNNPDNPKHNLNEPNNPYKLLTSCQDVELENA